MTLTYFLKSILLSFPDLSQWLQSITSARTKLLLLEEHYVNILDFKIASVTYLWLFEFCDSFSTHDTRDVSIKRRLALVLFTLYTFFTHTLGTVTFIFTNVYYYVIRSDSSIISFLLVTIWISSSSECGLLQTILHTLVWGNLLFICQTHKIQNFFQFKMASLTYYWQFYVNLLYSVRNCLIIQVMHFLFILSLLYTENNKHNQNIMLKFKHSRFSLASASERMVKARTASKT